MRSHQRPSRRRRHSSRRQLYHLAVSDSHRGSTRSSTALTVVDLDCNFTLHNSRRSSRIRLRDKLTTLCEDDGVSELPSKHVEFVYDELLLGPSERALPLLHCFPCSTLRDTCRHCELRASRSQQAEINPQQQPGFKASISSGARQLCFDSPPVVIPPRAAHHHNRSGISRPGTGALHKEVKAAKQLGVIMGAFTACFLPYFILFIVVAFCSDCVSGNLMLATTWIGYANSALNPVIYPLCNHTFRRTFRSLLSRLLAVLLLNNCRERN